MPLLDNNGIKCVPVMHTVSLSHPLAVTDRSQAGADREIKGQATAWEMPRKDALIL